MAKTLEEKTRQDLKSQLLSLVERVFDKRNAQKTSIYSNVIQEDPSKIFAKIITKNLSAIKTKKYLTELFYKFMKDSKITGP
jgi:hypothetical protein